MAERLTITVAAGGGDEDARAFISAFQDVLDLLDSLAKERYKKPEAIRWKIVSIEKHSPAKVVLENSSRRKIASALVTGLAAIQTDGRKSFGIGSLRIAKRIGERLDSRQIEQLTIKSGRTEFRTTPELANNAEELIDAGFYEMPSSVDGKLDIVNVHVGPKFSIFDEVFSREVKCRFPEGMLEIVKASLGKRVTASGLVRFNSASDQPISIVVEELEPLEEDGSALTLEEMPVIDVTGDESPEQFIRNQRDVR
jgi:hypothetical protein